jgi:hypothetical protein
MYDPPVIWRGSFRLGRETHKDYNLPFASRDGVVSGLSQLLRGEVPTVNTDWVKTVVQLGEVGETSVV